MFLCSFSFSFFQLMSFLIRPMYSNWSIFHCGQNWINTKKNVHNLFFLLLLPSICHHWGNINDMDKNIGQSMAMPKFGWEFHFPFSWRHTVLLNLDTSKKVINIIMYTSHFRNKRFALNKMFQWNASKFAIFYVDQGIHKVKI